MAIPPGSGVTGFVPKTTFKPAGAPELVRLTGEEKIPVDCTVIVEVPDVLGPSDSEDGDALIVKSAAPAVISTDTSAVWMSAPLVAVTRYVNGPIEAPGPAEIVNVEVATPPDSGVIGVGSTAPTSPGATPTHEPERSTAALNAFSEVTVHVLVMLLPCATLTEAGAQAMLKSGVGTGTEAMVMRAQFLAFSEGQSPQYPDASSQYSKWNPTVLPADRLKS